MCSALNGKSSWMASGRSGGEWMWMKLINEKVFIVDHDGEKNEGNNRKINSSLICTRLSLKAINFFRRKKNGSSLILFCCAVIPSLSRAFHFRTLIVRNNENSRSEAFQEKWNKSFRAQRILLFRNAHQYMQSNFNCRKFLCQDFTMQSFRME